MPDFSQDFLKRLNACSKPSPSRRRTNAKRLTCPSRSTDRKSDPKSNPPDISGHSVPDNSPHDENEAILTVCKADFRFWTVIDADFDDFCMKQALDLAREAAAAGEIPVGAVVVQTHGPDGLPLASPAVVARARNRKELEKDPLGHAEILAIRGAAVALNRWRLSGCSLYVTLEPCVMCAGAIIHARLDRVVFGTNDPKAGAVSSLYELLADSRLNHAPIVTAGVAETESRAVLQDFFRSLRAKRNAPVE